MRQRGVDGQCMVDVDVAERQEEVLGWLIVIGIRVLQLL